MNAIKQNPGSNQQTGRLGEETAVAYLERKGYAILDRNFRCKGGEVDIVASEAKTVVFVEVKARRSLSFGVPQLAVTPFKQRQIMKAALTWLAQHRQQNAQARFDVIAITLKSGSEPAIEHITNAFDLSY
jgi:putative endonuclease